MPRDTRSDFLALMDNVDSLLAETRSHVGTKIAESADTVEGQLDAFSEAVAHTDAMAKSAQAQLIDQLHEREALRAEKVATARHMLKVASRLVIA